MTHRTAICIKWGTKYDAVHVNRLYSGVRRNLTQPLRFVCVTDDASGLDPRIEVIPLAPEPFEPALRAALATSRRQGALRKVSLFRRDLIADHRGPILGFDLDVCITGALDPLFEHAPGAVAMRRDWIEARRGRPTGHGSVFRFDPARHHYLYDDFAADPAGWFARARGSEQKYTSWNARDHGDLAYFPDPWIASFKRDAMRVTPLNLFLPPRLPAAARVVCFHGWPKMEQAVAGHRSGLRYCRPTPWLADHWIDRANADLARP